MIIAYRLLSGLGISIVLRVSRRIAKIPNFAKKASCNKFVFSVVRVWAPDSITGRQPVILVSYWL